MCAKPHVIAVCLAAKHRFVKTPALEIHLVAGLGVEGDAHFGATSQHRYDKRYAPSKPNLRQLHMIDAATYQLLRADGFDVHPGDLGENVTTAGIDFTDMSAGTIVKIGQHAQLELTGLRQACVLIDKHLPGLRLAVERQGSGKKKFVRGGVMSRVLRDGVIRPGDAITLTHIPQIHTPMKIL